MLELPQIAELGAQGVVLVMLYWMVKRNQQVQDARIADLHEQLEWYRTYCPPPPTLSNKNATTKR